MNPAKPMDHISLLAENENYDYRRGFQNTFKVAFYGCSYCFASISTVFVNKVILNKKGEYKDFNSVEFLMLSQSILGSIFLLTCRHFKILKFALLLDSPRIKRVLAINALFIIMTTANAYGIQHLSMPMVGLLKNSQIVVVAILDYFILDNKPGKYTTISLGAVIFGSICGSLSDIEFSLIGYFAMTIAVFTSSLYFVLIKIVFRYYKVSEHTLCFFNNIISLPFFSIAAMKKGDLGRAFNFTIHASCMFWVYLLISGFAGSAVNLTTYLFLDASSPTAFSVLSVIKKITQTLLGYILWSAPTNFMNILSVIIGVLGGISYSVSKKYEKG